MSRSPLAYPLTRGIDADAGGAADLQTDIMRFMAILALCLVAIFALVQSIPLAPTAAAEVPPPPVEPAQPVEEQPVVAEVDAEPPPPVAESLAEPAPETEPAENVVLTRPQWVSTFQPRERTELVRPEPVPQPVAAAPTRAPSPVEEAPPAPAASEQEGFTLRFESDLALTRLVASGQVGFYAIESGRARRMSVDESRISFWDASTPGSFHEMEASTVPQPVVDALARAGADASGVDWGVTLPGRLSNQLNALMREHTGGALVIRGSGVLELEDS
ncbi:MAG: hypothetical protein QNI99_02125 [Woeseiaceae bacterium]|nr:hypothetical protein [Woeseiaceae bacterium]